MELVISGRHKAPEDSQQCLTVIGGGNAGNHFRPFLIFDLPKEPGITLTQFCQIEMYRELDRLVVLNKENGTLFIRNDFRQLLIQCQTAQYFSAF